MVVAANMQGKGVEFHNAIFSIEGNLNSDKLNKIIDDLEINSAKLNIDMSINMLNNIVATPLISSNRLNKKSLIESGKSFII